MIMNENNETITEIEQNAIIVGLNKGIRGEIDIEESMEELAELAKAAGANVLGMLIQNKESIDAKYYIGKGKIDEVKYACEVNEANLIIFNDELSGAQLRNIEEAIGVRVIDRTTLILDIFALRAKTKVAKLQVELAQLKYRLPRLKGQGASMSRTGAGIGTRGPGEQKLEIDRRRINERVNDIQARLKEERKNRETQRSKRMKSEIKTVAVVGYTNAGKSTLMNRMLMKFEEESESKIVFEKDMLFATLDTYHRRINLDDNKSIVLIDTVGFVSKLPHALIQAFKATLEEVTEADLLLHLVDVSNENYQMQIDITNEVLKELDVVDKPTVYVFNKTDKVKNQELIPRKENAINASLINNEGLDDVIQAVKTELFSDHIKCKLMIPYKDGNVLSKILENSIVYNQEHKAEGTEIEVELSVIDHSRYAMYEV